MKHCGINPKDLGMTREQFEEYLPGYSDELLKHMMTHNYINPTDCGVCIKCGAKVDGECSCIECPVCGYRSCDSE